MAQCLCSLRVFSGIGIVGLPVRGGPKVWVAWMTLSGQGAGVVVLDLGFQPKNSLRSREKVAAHDVIHDAKGLLDLHWGGAPMGTGLGKRDLGAIREAIGVVGSPLSFVTGRWPS